MEGAIVSYVNANKGQLRVTLTASYHRAGNFQGKVVFSFFFLHFKQRLNIFL